MAYCKVRQAEIYYEDLGEGVPVLMIHGYTPDHRLLSGCMEPVFSKREGWRRIYFDLPGMGLTKNYKAIRSSDDMLNAVLEFIQAVLHGQDYLIVGESYGGYLSRGIIQKQKEHILGAAFICPCIVPFQADRSVDKHQLMSIDNEFIKTLPDEALMDFKSNSVVLDEYNWLRFSKEILTGCKIADEEFLIKVKNHYAFSFKIDQFDFNKPSVFLLGRQDSSVGYRDALKLVGKYPRGTVAVLDRAGHNLQIEQPQLFNCLIDEWLDRVEEIKN
ncbi:alpha/beta fold hydrolase [Sporolactobacillus pectinivorans]|uniref:alpha/beta fold hydrolase n=1 Tax=Sporolactobacillus pectinivorans TaxID=1591408 RepID=UPI000C264A50|nr:alpha/beta hydrolase [Sporolactobacillus pectinivorans]